MSLIMSILCFLLASVCSLNFFSSSFTACRSPSTSFSLANWHPSFSNSDSTILASAA